MIWRRRHRPDAIVTTPLRCVSGDGHLQPSQIHSRLDHPIIDDDGHWVQYDPVFSDQMPKAEAGGPVRRESHHGRDYAP
jgi:hypothetical protein